MRSRPTLRFCVEAAVLLSIAMIPAAVMPTNVSADQQGDTFTATFDAAPDELVSIGRNPFFVLEPGYQLVLEGPDEHLTITVLSDTRRVDGVETRIVEERETNKQNELVEVSRNFFAISKRTNSVFYFGEDVDMYKGGKISNHEGSWMSGVNGAKFGLAMPGEPLLKARYYQERAPRIAMDRGEIVDLDDRVVAPAGTFDHVLKVHETTPIEPLSRENKYYARGVGLVQDGSAKLVRFGKTEQQN